MEYPFAEYVTVPHFPGVGGIWLLNLHPPPGLYATNILQVWYLKTYPNPAQLVRPFIFERVAVRGFTCAGTLQTSGISC